MFFNLLFCQRYLDKVWSRVELAIVRRPFVQFFKLLVSLLDKLLLVVLFFVLLNKVLARIKNSGLR